MSYYISREQEKAIDEYRAVRKLQLGKMITRQRALNELLQIALNQQPKPAELLSYQELVRRVEALEFYNRRLKGPDHDR